MKSISSFVRYILLLMLAVCLIITCKKEYSYEGGANAAVYTFPGTRGICANAIISGDYVTGVPLNSANTVQLVVYVTQAGSYSQSVSGEDGIGFSAAGIFSDTGLHAITLAGAGIPLNEGNYSFWTTGSSCSFLITVTQAKPPAAVFSLAGSPNQCTDAIVWGSYINGTSLTATNTVDAKVEVIKTGPFKINTDTLDGISFSAAGNFVQKGLQVVTLTGAGTPGRAGNFSFTPLADTSHCTFTLTVTNPPPLAIYVLKSGFGSPSPCIYTVSGSYTAGEVLTATNTVTINVFVTQPGNFTIETNLVNGMFFYFSGSFAAAGAQKVTLTGQGTPAAIGTFSLAPQIVGPHLLGGQTCSFDIGVK